MLPVGRWIDYAEFALFMRSKHGVEMTHTTFNGMTAAGLLRNRISEEAKRWQCFIATPDDLVCIIALLIEHDALVRLDS